MALKLSDDEKVRLEFILRHRQLNSAFIALFTQAKASHNLTSSDLSVAKNQNYGDIVETTLTAVSKGWIKVDDIIHVLGNSEIAGRQHVCLFTIPGNSEGERKKVLSVLRSPKAVAASAATLSDFLEVPTSSSATVLLDSPDTVLVKIVTSREYWTTNPLEQSPDREVYERLRHKERCAIIIKANSKTGLLQFRVPPREKQFQQETSTLVYRLLTQVLPTHYHLNANKWFDSLKPFQIADTFKKLLKNRKEFELWYDTPHNRQIRIKLGRIGRPKRGHDLRDDPNWNHQTGYARNSIRGFWRAANGDVYLHLNTDAVRIDAKTTRSIARIFLPYICTDQDIDNVIAGLCAHL